MDYSKQPPISGSQRLKQRRNARKAAMQSMGKTVEELQSIIACVANSMETLTAAVQQMNVRTDRIIRDIGRFSEATDNE